VDYIKPEESVKSEEIKPEIAKEENNERPEDQMNVEPEENKKTTEDTIIDGGLPTPEVQPQQDPEVFLTSTELISNQEIPENVVEEFKESSVELGKVETVEMLNSNANKQRIIDRPSPQVDPTRL
jgi:hypothetical protein